MKNSKTAVQNRHDRLLNYIRENERVEVAVLAQKFHVTPTTIRRDLELFETKGYIKRYFGGAKSLIPAGTKDYQAPVIPPGSSRYTIAETAAKLIEPGDTVFMNSSSTALLIFNYLKNTPSMFITNNGRALYAKRDPEIELILTGGEVYGQKQSLVGEIALSTLSKVTATKCILGVSGISAGGGITSMVIQETPINQAMLKHCSGDKIVVAEGSKIGIKHNFFSGTIQDITHLITDDTADPAQLDQLRAQGITVIVTASRH